MGSEEFDGDPPPLFTKRAGTRVGELGIGTEVRADESVRLAEGEQSAAMLQLVLTDAIGQEPELADANQAGGQHVQQKAADELSRFQHHGLGPAVIRIVLPLKNDATIFQGS